MQTTRRQFLKTTALAGTTLAAAPWIQAQSRARPYRTVLSGCGWWGNNILGEAMASGACRIVGLCDVDQRFLKQTAERVKTETGDDPKTYGDYRELLRKEKPDIAIIATPDHWHPLQAIAAVEAGAHVYVEKPISHTILEGRAMVKAARAADRRVTVGTHRRVSPHNLSAYEFIKAGKLGKVGLVRCFVCYGGGPETPKKNVEVPDWLDWEMWCGPAPKRPYNGREGNPWNGGIHPRGFRNYLDYANGTIADWGIHWFDQVLWMMNVQSPKTVFCTGGRPIAGPPILTKEEQTSDAPDSQVASYDMGDFRMTWEHRRFAGNNQERGENVGCHFFGQKGVLHVGWRQGWTFYPVNQNQPEVHVEPHLHEPDSQNIKELWADFLAAIREKRRPACDIELGYQATVISLLGMLSWKLGRSVEWDAAKHECIGDPEANRLLKRDYRPGWKYPV